MLPAELGLALCTHHMDTQPCFSMPEDAAGRDGALTDLAVPLHGQLWASKLASVSYVSWSGSLSSGCSYTLRMRRAEPPQWGHPCCPWLLKAAGLQATCPALLRTQVLHSSPQGHLCQARERALGLLGPAGLRCRQRPLHRGGDRWCFHQPCEAA